VCSSTMRLSSIYGLHGDDAKQGDIAIIRVLKH
jgi:hypothetical protein